MEIEFLTECTGWDPGFIAEVEEEDDKYFYFNDVNDRWTCVEKDKRGVDFVIVVDKEKQRKNIIDLFEMSKDDEDFICGGEETTYNNLIKRVKKMKNED